ncbi:MULTISPECIES: hypothetical protein [Amycolatopsis]|uniref:Uncharacterized protein n=1 Tax=Amycolatopsis thermoflava TaxID=84480 RepID=A0A3N2GX07_9PSEU|nr:hypothetical protein [Amycolatopsis thermoflava]ROS41113.1 hypothetical protein EDD35_3464 [Amycolatopsis thermoflava]
MVVNVAIYLVVCATPPVLFWLASKAPAVAAAFRRRREPAPSGLPIERLAADLRRVHRCLTDLAPDAPMLRRRATHQAYDALLVQACAALGLPHWLDELPEGVERDIERLRVEESLRRAGLVVP